MQCKWTLQWKKHQTPSGGAMFCENALTTMKQDREPERELFPCACCKLTSATFGINGTAFATLLQHNLIDTLVKSTAHGGCPGVIPHALELEDVPANNIRWKKLCRQLTLMMNSGPMGDRVRKPLPECCARHSAANRQEGRRQEQKRHLQKWRRVTKNPQS
jgi:hypothetical protein